MLFVSLAQRVRLSGQSRSNRTVQPQALLPVHTGGMTVHGAENGASRAPRDDAVRRRPAGGRPPAPGPGHAPAGRAGHGVRGQAGLRRAEGRLMGRSPQRYAAVSVFSGCGGLDLGAERSGRARVVWAVDNEHWAVETYRRNLGRHVVEADVTQTAVPDVPCDILLAGPPCQDYSTLWNHDGLITARGNLFRHVARYLDAL